MARYTRDYDGLERRFRDLVRECDPELLILPHPDDYHHHHRAVSAVALNASANAGNASIKSDFPPASGVPAALYMQPLPPTPFAPDLYVDISTTVGRKIEALAAHESQLPFLRSHHRTDMPELVRLTARLHGAACDAACAEAYALCRRLNRVRTLQALSRFFPVSPEGDDRATSRA
jgi:N-acetylglucosamine malate deacetylase 1